MQNPSRRHVLLGLSAIAALPSAPCLAFAEGLPDRKFILVILRGALDGLAAVIPDDEALAGLRGPLLPDPSERLDIGQGFGLHPSLSALKAMHARGEAGFVHAAATLYRGRSHFDAQDALETLAPSGTRDGWLNRAVGAIGGRGLAVGHTVPLVLRGTAPATNWSPPVLDPAPSALLDRLADLYARDQAFATTLAGARAMADNAMAGVDGRPGGGPSAIYRESLAALGTLMAADDGPGIGVVSLDGWDTHANQSAQLSQRLRGLDDGLEALRVALDGWWRKSCVVVCSEFGRTVRVNGTLGTDHGTGGAIILLGGAVRGGRVHGDWPGISETNLFEGRDLAPANAVTAVLSGVLRDHLGLDRTALARQVFPGGATPLDNLIA